MPTAYRENCCYHSLSHVFVSIAHAAFNRSKPTCHITALKYKPKR